MKNEIECPYCPGIAKLQKAEKNILFRKEEFPIIEHFYKCNSCSEEFGNTEVDNLNVNQVYNQYREKYKVPFQEEIVELRNAYNLSASQMSEIFGFGANTYSNYEKGEVPSIANGKLISSAMDPDLFLKFTVDAKSFLKEAVVKKITQKVHEKKEINKECEILDALVHAPNRFNGYQCFKKEKLIQGITYFLTQCNQDYNDRVKINKLLFCSDFLNFRNSGYSIFGLSYVSGDDPEPQMSDLIFYFLKENRFVTNSYEKVDKGLIVELFKSQSDPLRNVFSEFELNTLNIIGERFRNTNSWDLRESLKKNYVSSAKHLLNYQDNAFELEV